MKKEKKNMPKFNNPKGKILERDITKAIKDYLTARKIFHYKHWQGAFSTPGISDIIGCWHGRFFAIEVKTLKGKVTPAQQRFQDNVREAGGLAIIARSVDDVIEFFEIIWEEKTS
jgi:hypothetical protein